jgi:hypothetical protein
MQMPAGQLQRGASMNVYTGLLFVAVVALIAASAFVYVQASMIGPDGNALGSYELKPDGTYDTAKLPK